MKIEQKHFDAMLSGQKCKFWNDDGDDEVVRVLYAIRADDYPFTDIRGVDWQNCEPIKTVRYLKEPVDLMKTLIEGGWSPYYKGIFWHPEKMAFDNKMWQDCGKPESEWSREWEVDPSWIEEREE